MVAEHNPPRSGPGFAITRMRRMHRVIRREPFVVLKPEDLEGPLRGLVAGQATVRTRPFVERTERKEEKAAEENPRGVEQPEPPPQEFSPCHGRYNTFNESR